MVVGAVNTLRGILSKSQFDPRQSDMRFSMACTDSVEFTVPVSCPSEDSGEGRGVTSAVRRVPTM